MTGQTLGHYRIIEKIGAGGMGEVYRATDSRLGRSVAIKLLPDVFARDPERLARFDQEARLLAALNHPNIAAIYGLEEAQGAGPDLERAGGRIQFLVLELVPGETLAEGLSRGALPVEEALEVCRQIAEALEAAHERGIIHRDLKPANVKVTPEGKVKVLDFGLAKAFSPEGGAGVQALSLSPAPGASPQGAAGAAPGAGPGSAGARVDLLSASPTATYGATRAGVILGTAAYMSPEQARGKPLDKRTDIWSFGCVLYEALTGRQAFAGETISDTIANVLNREPEWSAVPAGTPTGVRRLLRRCLEKKAERRLRDSGDVRIEIEDALLAPAAAADEAQAARPSRGWLLPGGILAGIAVIAATVALWSLTRPRPPASGLGVRRLSLSLPAGASLAAGASDFTLSPDGSRLVYAARAGATTQLYQRPLDRSDATPIPGTEGGEAPFLSPDGRWVGFTAGGKLKKVPLSGGSAMTLAELSLAFKGAWGTDDMIIFNSAYNLGLAKIPAAGGKPVALTTPDASKGELGHWHPVLLPGGESVLFTIYGTGGLPAAKVALLDLRTGEIRTLIEGGFNARYASSGHLVYARSTTLMAVAFDLDKRAVAGEPVPVLEGIAVDVGEAAAVMALSEDGTLIYRPSSANLRRLVWVDPAGRSTPITDEFREYGTPEISPDGRKIAVDLVRDGNPDLWALDLSRGILTRLTSTANGESRPRWSPDGRHVAFMADTRAYNLYWVPADGNTPPEVLWETELDKMPGSWSPDGKGLAFTQNAPSTTKFDIWLLRVDGERSARPLLQTPFDEVDPAFSPDGRWLAFASDESGRYEIYAAPVANPASKMQVSTHGGTEPSWAPSGREIFYRQDAKMMGVSLRGGQGLSLDAPKVLFEREHRHTGMPLRDYSVAPGERRFVMIEQAEERSSQENLQVILNWTEDLKRQVRAP